MQQFVVPQFIDVEGKIIWFITTRQFVILLVGALGSFLAFRFGDLTLWISVTVLIGFFVALFGFVKVNGRPFHFFFLNFIQTLFVRKMLRVWQREAFTVSLSSAIRKKKKKGDKETISPLETHKKLTTRSELSELALIVDTGGVYKVEEETPYGIL